MYPFGNKVLSTKNTIGSDRPTPTCTPLRNNKSINYIETEDDRAGSMLNLAKSSGFFWRL